MWIAKIQKSVVFEFNPEKEASQPNNSSDFDRGLSEEEIKKRSIDTRVFGGQDCFFWLSEQILITWKKKKKEIFKAAFGSYIQSDLKLIALNCSGSKV